MPTIMAKEKHADIRRESSNSAKNPTDKYL
jgi:hypothetical protein